MLGALKFRNRYVTIFLIFSAVNWFKNYTYASARCGISARQAT